MTRVWLRRIGTGAVVAALTTAGFAAPATAEPAPTVSSTSSEPTLASGLKSGQRPGSAASAASPTIDGVDASDPNAAEALDLPNSDRLWFTVQKQNKNYTCVPASGSMSLETFGLSVSENTLADKMGTTSSGTSGNQALPVMNSYVKPKGYKYTFAEDVADSPTTLLNRTATDIHVHEKAPVLGVWAEDLPWNKDEGFGNNTGHAIVLYAYNFDEGTVKVADPWTDSTHEISAKTLAAASQKDGGMWYVSKL